MKTTKLLLLFVALATLSLTSCKKDEPEPTKTELLTGEWKIKKAEHYTNGTLDEMEILDEIEVKLIFYSDHTGKTTNNGVEKGIWTWSFNSDETYLTLSSEDQEIYNIEKLDNSNLWLSETTTNEDGDETILRFILEK